MGAIYYETHVLFIAAFSKVQVLRYEMRAGPNGNTHLHEQVNDQWNHEELKYVHHRTDLMNIVNDCNK